MPGRYRFNIYATVNGVVADWIKDAASFDVEVGDFFGSGRLPPSEFALVMVAHRFAVEAPASVAAASPPSVRRAKP
jgi:lipopolysaccharide transport system ATP-binding protein